MEAVVAALPYLVPSVAVAAVDWYAVVRGNKKLEYVTKPLTIVLLIAAVVYMSATYELSSHGPKPADPGFFDRDFGLLVAALLFSLAGDVFLMLPRNLFVLGLASFLGAHVCYVIAFQPSAPGRHPLVIGSLVALLVVGAIFYSQLKRGMVDKGKGALIPAVLLYLIVISQMVASAVANNAEPDFPQTQATIGTIGALLFYGSDAMIAWSRFVKDFKWSHVAIHATYHLAQIGLVLSFVR